MSKPTIGLIGFGTIGQYIYKHLKEELDFKFIYDVQAPQEASLASLYVNSKEALAAKCAGGVQLVVECAVAGALVDLTPTVLKYSDLLAFSVTAFAEDSFRKQVEELCDQYSRRFYVPHGAILGLDGIGDAKDILESVTITTTKRPKNLGRTDTARVVAYEGPTRGACKLFPRNVNVHAGIATAGLGFDKTCSKIVSDPASSGNHHEIEVLASGCKFKIEVESVPGAGVTGAYTPVSACSAIRRILLAKGIVTI